MNLTDCLFQLAVTYRNPIKAMFILVTALVCISKFENEASDCLAAWRAIIAGQGLNEVPTFSRLKNSVTRRTLQRRSYDPKKDQRTIEERHTA